MGLPGPSSSLPTKMVVDKPPFPSNFSQMIEDIRNMSIEDILEQGHVDSLWSDVVNDHLFPANSLIGKLNLNKMCEIVKHPNYHCDDEFLETYVACFYTLPKSVSVEY